MKEIIRLVSNKMIFNKSMFFAVLTMLVLAFGCSAPPDTLGELDLVKWRNDRGGCKGDRVALEKTFKNEQDKIMGKFADDIGTILGKPDIQQLGGRNQKFYVYFLEKGPHCNDITQKSSARKVVLKFNALGLLSEVTLQTLPLR